MSSPHCLQFLSSFFFLNPLPLGLESVTPPKTSTLLNPILKSCSPLLTCSIYSTDSVEYSLLLELPSLTRTSLSPSSPAMLVVPSQCLLLDDHILESSAAPSLDVFSPPCMSTLGISPGLKVLIHTKKPMAPQDISQAGSTPLNSRLGTFNSCPSPPTCLIGTSNLTCKKPSSTCCMHNLPHFN